MIGRDVLGQVSEVPGGCIALELIVWTNANSVRGLRFMTKTGITGVDVLLLRPHTGLSLIRVLAQAWKMADTVRVRMPCFVPGFTARRGASPCHRGEACQGHGPIDTAAPHFLRQDLQDD